MFAVFVVVHAVHHQVGGVADQVGGRLLHRRRRHHRLPERPRDRRRLHVGGVVPRHLGRGDGRAAIDGLIYSIGFLVGWPVITFLMAERLRNLGKFTFADVAAFRFAQTPVRIFAASRHAGRRRLLPDRADGRRGPADQAAVRARLLDRRRHRRRADDGLRAVRRHDRDHLGADHQGLPAARPARPSWRFMVLWHYGFSPEAMFARRGRGQDRARRTAGKTPEEALQKGSRSWARAASSRTRSRRSRFGMALMFGTAGLPHILMRFFTVPSAKEARKSVMWATDLDRLLLPPDLHHRLRRDHLRADRTRSFLDAKGALIGGNNMAAVHLADAVGGNVFLGFISAVAFATILAVVAGLTLSGASACRTTSTRPWSRRARPTAPPSCASRGSRRSASASSRSLLGIVFEKQNIAFMVSLAFAVAASANFPVLFMSVLWKDCTTKGAVVGGFLGLISSVAADHRCRRRSGRPRSATRPARRRSPTPRRRCSR